jgi:hypothetical protein
VNSLPSGKQSSGQASRELASQAHATGGFDRQAAAARLMGPALKFASVCRTDIVQIVA